MAWNAMAFRMSTPFTGISLHLSSMRRRYDGMRGVWRI
jgi:hypothetical protein